MFIIDWKKMYIVLARSFLFNEKKNQSVFRVVSNKPAAFLPKLSFQAVNDICNNMFEEIASPRKGVLSFKRSIV